MTQQPTSPFHPGEIAVQQRAGVAEKVAQYGERFIRNSMPQQHRDFLAELPFVILGLVDQQGYPWAMPLFGQEGFISSPSDTLLTVNTLPILNKVIELDFTPGKKIGVLGIQLATRRRNRMNGVIDSISENGFSIRVEQSFGNCPQYIQTRELVWQTNHSTDPTLKNAQATPYIDETSKAFIKQTDTFFIASRTKNIDQDSLSGVDVSHRGGKPGFIKVDDNKLYFPDFSGNNFFNTLGNIQSDKRVGLFFPNYSTGDAFFIVGNATTLWDDPAIERFEGAERIIEIDVHKVLNVPNFMPMKGELIEYSRVLNRTGTWEK